MVEICINVTESNDMDKSLRLHSELMDPVVPGWFTPATTFKHSDVKSALYETFRFLYGFIDGSNTLKLISVFEVSGVVVHSIYINNNRMCEMRHRYA